MRTMIMFFKVLASLLLLLTGFAPRATLGVYIFPKCLLRICSGEIDTCPPPPTSVMNQTSSAAGKLTVDLGELGVINSLLSLRSADEETFYCSASDVIKYSSLIACDCPYHGLCRLTGIFFSNMNLKGGFPTKGFENLKYLRNLDLRGNQLSGLIPESLVNLVYIEYINLCDNNLTGPIPPFNGRNTELKGLYLCKNLLNGSIPREFGELGSLKALHLNRNNLTGPIPREFWNAKNLTQLRLQENQLNGSIPDEITNLNNLEELLLMNNGFSGELPKSFSNLTNLINLKIQGCIFTGTIPSGIDQLSNLRTLWLLGSNFTGPLPTTFQSRYLFGITISDVSGDINGNKFPNFGATMMLMTLTLRNCSLSGPIPPEIMMLPNLTYLDLSFNNLYGQLPPSLGKRLRTIYLRKNKLNESLPEWINNESLYIDMSDNIFTNISVIKGNISDNVNLFSCCSHISNSNAKWLDTQFRCGKDTPTRDHLYINCGGNAETINGNTYQNDLNSHGASSFYFGEDSRWGYSSMGKSLYRMKNKYIVEEKCNISMVDAPLYTRARTTPISLKYYGFCLKNDEYIVKLHFAEIGWGGNSKTVIGKRTFDVEIQGKKLKDFNIESEAQGIYKSVTKEFRAIVDDSRLEIHFYWSGKGSMTVPQQYGPLISAISVSPVPKRKLLLIGAIVGSSVVFVALVLALFWKLGLLRAKKTNKDGVELYPGGFYKFEQIRDATNNFSPENQIGDSGKVYKGILKDARAAQQKGETETKLLGESTKDETKAKPKDEIVIAVKKLSAKTKEGVLKILQEIGLLYTLEHPNIAKPMGCCTKDRQVLIVYKYMENISLQYALFDADDDVKSQLNWQTRWKICLGIAKGLVFLHEESQLGIIHSNIKPTNILLDKEFNVKISDFGYSELHDERAIEKGTLHTPRAKDIGHMAPEYMQGHHLTPKSDVYSFGLVALEIISGQPHIMVKTKEDIHLINTAYTCYAKDNLEALIDGCLSRYADYKHNEVVSMLHLAMECVSPGFDLRPSIFEVVQVLEGKKKLNKRQIHAMATLEHI